MNEMRNRVRRITRELNALQEEIAAMRKHNASQQLEEILTPELTTDLKSSVTGLWRLLCHESDLRSTHSQVGSFIEKVEAIIQKKMPGQK